jgi:ubiquitin C-terminal hydrolase
LVSSSLNPEESSSFLPTFRLAFQRALYSELTGGLTGAADSGWLETLKVGSSLDALAADKSWRVAKVVSLRSVTSENSSSTSTSASSPRIVRVSFKGWGATFDEDIPQSLKRLARLGTHTAGKDTRRNAKQGESFRVDIEVLSSLETKIDMLLDGTFPAEERDTFTRGELPEYVLEVMSSKYEDTETISAEDLRNRSNQFNAKVLGLCVHHINAIDVPIPPEILQHLQRYFLMDERCNFFYVYGHMYHDDPKAPLVMDKAAAFPATTRASKYWVANVNAFWKQGGMEAVLNRYNAHTASANAAIGISNTTDIKSTELFSQQSSAWADQGAMNELVIVIKAVCMGKWCFTRYWGETYFAQLRDCVMGRLRSLSDVQLKRVDVSEIDEIRNAFFETAKVLLERFGMFENFLAHRRILCGPNATIEDPIETYTSSFDRLALHFWVKLLAIDSLTLRVKAISELNEIYRSVSQSIDSKTSTSINSARGFPRNRITLQDLLCFTCENRVINLLLGEIEPGCPNSQVHFQILSRIGAKEGVLEMTALSSRLDQSNESKTSVGLTSRHIDLLWNIFLEAHGDASVRHLVLDIIDTISRKLPYEFYIQLFHLYSKIPLSEFDEPLVRTVANLTKYAFTNASSLMKNPTFDPTPIRFGINLLWDMCCIDVHEEDDLNDAVPCKEVVDAAQFSFLDLLQKLDQSRDLLQTYVKRAIETIVRGDANIQHVRMLGLLLARLGPTSSVTGPLSIDLSTAVVKKLFSEFNVCEALVRDIQLYKERAIKVENKRKLASSVNPMPATLSSPESQSETVYYGRYSHSDNLSERLRLLSLLSVKADVRLSVDQVSTLWKALIDTAMSANERETFYDWLQTAVRPSTRNSFSFIGSKDMQAIFITLFCNVKQPWNVKNLGMKGLSCFKNLFEVSNAESGRLAIIKEEIAVNKMADFASLKEHFVLLKIANPAGLNTLWNIVLTAQDNVVSDEAAIYLVHLFLFSTLPFGNILDPFNSDPPSKSALGLWTDFVSNCMHRLDSALKESGGVVTPLSAGAQTSGRIIRLLLNFLINIKMLRDNFNSPFYKMPFNGTHYIVFPEEGLPWNIESSFVFTQKISIQSLSDTSNSGYISVPAFLRIRRNFESIGNLRDRLADYLKHDPKLLPIFIYEKHIPTRFTAANESNTIRNPIDNLFCEQLRQNSVSHEVLAEIASHVYNDRNNRILQSVTRLKELLKREGMDNDVSTFIPSSENYEAFDSAFEAPQKLLSDSPEYFEALFSLLRLSLLSNPVLVHDIWKLIQFIPRAPSKVSSIHTMNGLLGNGDEIRDAETEESLVSLSNHVQCGSKIFVSPSWEDILGGGSPLALLYSLQILHSKLEAEGKVAILKSSSPRAGIPESTTSSTNKFPLPHHSGSVDVQSLWGRAFARRGGVEYLYSKVMEVNLEDLFASSKSDEGSSLLMQCATLLLKIFARFIITPTFGLRSFYSMKGAERFVFSVNRKALALRMLEWIAFSSTVSLARSNCSEDDLRKAEKNAASAAIEASRAARFSEENNTQLPAQNSSVSLVSEILQACVEIIAVCLSGAEEVPTFTRSTAALSEVKKSSALLIPHPDVFQAVYESLNQTDVIATALFATSDVRARETLVTSLEDAWIISAAAEKNQPLPSAIPSLHIFFLSSFLKNIRLLYAFPNTCSQFVDLLASKLLPLTLEKSVDGLPEAEIPIDKTALLSELSNMIRSHPVVEVGSETSDVYDDVLSGLLIITRNVLVGRPSLRSLAGVPLEEGGFGLLHEVFSKCLFSFLDMCTPLSEQRTLTESIQPYSVLGGQLPKCKQMSTRAAALSLLSELAKGDARNCLALAREFLPHHDALAANELAISANALKAGNSAESVTDSSGPMFATATTTLARLLAPRHVSVDATESNMTASARSQRAALLPRSSTGYVGLKNLGCICYMNATLQQFFMTPAFRAAVLSHQETGTSDSEKNDSIMFQLQRQFAYLQESEKAFFTPVALCSAIKDYEGRPTNYFEQKDVPEFLTKLFTDMESQLQGTRLSNIAKDLYGLNILSELFADDPRGGDRPRLYSSKDTSDYFIQVFVKGFKNLTDSLESLFQGEQVDFKWELPQEDGGGGGGGEEKSSATVSVKTTKRSSLKNTGDFLMIHFNRFDFDYDKLENEKINDRFEFPSRLDLYPYTIYGRSAPTSSSTPSSNASTLAVPNLHGEGDASSFLYDLVGVVVHMGTAVGGHYISYIRERSQHGTLPSDRWYEFNDAFVSPWAGLNRLDEDCFGGTERVKNQSWQLVDKPKTANAFCLFYDRVRPDKRISSNSASTSSSSSSSIVMQPKDTVSLPKVEILTGKPPRVLLPKVLLESHSQQLRSVHGSGCEYIRAQLRAPVPLSILDTIRRENLSFWRQVYTQQPAYTACMKSLASSYMQAIPARQKVAKYPWKPITSLSDAIERGGEGLIVARLMWSFGLNSIQESVTPDPTISDDWIENVGQLFSSNLIASSWLLQDVLADGGDTLRKVLLLGSDQGPAARTRSFVSKVLCAVINVIWPVELKGPKTEKERFESEEAQSLHQSTGRLVLDLIDFLIQQMQDAHKHHRNFSSMFEILHCFSRASDASRQYLLDARMIGRICDLLVTGHSPDPSVNAAPWPPLRAMSYEETNSLYENRIIQNEDTRSNFDKLTGLEYISFFHMAIWLLHDLVRGSLPLGASIGLPRLHQTSPFQLLPAQPLHDVDRRLLTSFVLAESLLNKRCLLYQIGNSTSHGRSKAESFLLDAIAPIYAHLIWDIDPPQIFPSSSFGSPIQPPSPRTSLKNNKGAEEEVEGFASWHGIDAPEVTANSNEKSQPSRSSLSVKTTGTGNLIGILTAVARQMLREDYEHHIRSPFLVARIIGLNAPMPMKFPSLSAPIEGLWPLPVRNSKSTTREERDFLQHSYQCISFTLHHLVTEMKRQSRFYAETIRSTEHLLYLARIDNLASLWCSSDIGREDLSWCKIWFKRNTDSTNECVLLQKENSVDESGAPLLQCKAKDREFSLRFYHSLDPQLYENVMRLVSGQSILCCFIDIEEELSDDIRLSKFVGQTVKVFNYNRSSKLISIDEGKIENIEVRPNTQSNSYLDIEFRIQTIDKDTNLQRTISRVVPGGQRAPLSYSNVIPPLQYIIVDQRDDETDENETEVDETDEDETNVGKLNENGEDYEDESKAQQYENEGVDDYEGDDVETGLTIRKLNNESLYPLRGLGIVPRNHPSTDYGHNLRNFINVNETRSDYRQVRMNENNTVDDLDYNSDRAEEDYDDDDEDDDDIDNRDEIEDEVDEELQTALRLSSEEALAKEASNLALVPPVLPSDPPSPPV